MQQRFSSSTFGYPWINYKCVKISRNTHARRHTSNIVFIIPTMQLNQIKKKKNKAHRFQLFHPPALMGRVQRSVVQGRVYLLPLQILYRFLNSLCNITGAFLKSVLSHKGAVSQNFIEIQPVRTAIKLRETKEIIIVQEVNRRYEYQRKYMYLQRNLMIRDPTFSGLTFMGLTSSGFYMQSLTFRSLTSRNLTSRGLTSTGVTPRGLTFRSLTSRSLMFRGLTTRGLTSRGLKFRSLRSRGSYVRGLTSKALTFRGS